VAHALPRAGLPDDSGYGRFGGKAAINEPTELRWITILSGHRLPILIAHHPSSGTCREPAIPARRRPPHLPYSLRIS